MKLAATHAEQRTQRVYVDAGLHSASNRGGLRDGSMVSHHDDVVSILDRNVAHVMGGPETKLTPKQSSEEPGVIIT